MVFLFPQLGTSLTNEINIVCIVALKTEINADTSFLILSCWKNRRVDWFHTSSITIMRVSDWAFINTPIFMEIGTRWAIVYTMRSLLNLAIRTIIFSNTLTIYWIIIITINACYTVVTWTRTRFTRILAGFTLIPQNKESIRAVWYTSIMMKDSKSTHTFFSVVSGTRRAGFHTFAISWL